jgi:hypothetical protein
MIKSAFRELNAEYLPRTSFPAGKSVSKSTASFDKISEQQSLKNDPDPQKQGDSDMGSVFVLSSTAFPNPFAFKHNVDDDPCIALYPLLKVSKTER